MSNNVVALPLTQMEHPPESIKPIATPVTMSVEPTNKSEAASVTPELPKRPSWFANNWQAYTAATLLPLVTFAIVIGLWLIVQKHFATDLPTPVDVWNRATEVFASPFYDNGPNDKGIGWQVLYSLGRVMAGFSLAVIVGIPVGFLMGMSANFSRACTPLIQILRPVSPLAWLPIGLLLFKAVDPSAIFVIFITSIWPIIINTSAGVRAIPKDYMNVAAVLQLNTFEITRKILLPSTLPHILTGMRLSLNIAWMVIVAAEMLTGGIGIGFYVWDEWNNLNVSSIVVAILLIGSVGILLEGIMNFIQSRFDYNAR